jgi:formylglycine-generating enzyme required for sulfatase activity
MILSIMILASSTICIIGFLIIVDEQCSYGVLRGGAWNTLFDKVTCFYRKDAVDTSFAGFRCVKEVESGV